jgi:hypothetical protein
MKANPRPRPPGRPADPTRQKKSGEHGVSIDDALKRGDDVKTVRLQVAVHAAYEATLNDMKKKTRVTTVADVVRAALDKYAQQLLSVNRGGQLILVRPKRPDSEWQVLADEEHEADGGNEDGQVTTGKSMRLQLLLHPDYARTLEVMKRISKEPTYADVVRAALENYDRLLNLKRDERVVVVRASGEREILFEHWQDLLAGLTAKR